MSTQSSAPSGPHFLAGALPFAIHFSRDRRPRPIGEPAQAVEGLASSIKIADWRSASSSFRGWRAWPPCRRGAACQMARKLGDPGAPARAPHVQDRRARKTGRAVRTSDRIGFTTSCSPPKPRHSTGRMKPNRKKLQIGPKIDSCCSMPAMHRGVVETDRQSRALGPRATRDVGEECDECRRSRSSLSWPRLWRASCCAKAVRRRNRFVRLKRC